MPARRTAALPSGRHNFSGAINVNNRCRSPEISTIIISCLFSSAFAKSRADDIISAVPAKEIKPACLQVPVRGKKGRRIIMSGCDVLSILPARQEAAATETLQPSRPMHIRPI